MRQILVGIVLFAALVAAGLGVYTYTEAGHDDEFVPQLADQPADPDEDWGIVECTRFWGEQGGPVHSEQVPCEQ